MGHALSSAISYSTTSTAHLSQLNESATMAAHIHDLPFELLQEILVCAAFIVDEHQPRSFVGQRYDELDDTRGDLCSAWNWLNVMVVCKLWQKAASESPWFHSRIALQNPTAMARSIALSHQLPLHIISGHTRSWNDRALSPLVDLFHSDALSRVCEVDLLASPEAMSMIEPLTTTMLGKPAPTLRRLRLRYIPGVDNTKTIDAELYGTHDYPLLQEVALHGLEFTIKTPFLSPTLRSLSLTHCRLFEHSDAQALHDLLRTMPLLEVLDLRDITLANLAEPRRISLPEHPLRLECLQRLTLEAPYLTVYRFLDVIDFPTTAVVELSFENVTSASLKLGPPEKMLEFYRRHLGAASVGGAGYTRVGAHLDISPFDGQLSYAWTFSHPHHFREGAVLPRAMSVKWAFSIRQHEEFPIMASFVGFIVELIPHTHTPHTLHFLQSGSFARWRGADEEPEDYDCWFEACRPSLQSVVELWLVGGAALDALYWFANDQGCGGWCGRSDYPALKLLGFRNANLGSHDSFICERDGRIEGVARKHLGKDFKVKFRDCELPDCLKREMEESFEDRLQIL